MVFHDRADAGRCLAAKLAHYKGEEAVVFALPRGGVPVAAPIAAMLQAPLDLVLARKIGAPFQPELAMGAVADGGSPVVVRNEDVIAMAGVDEVEFDAACRRELAEIERRRHLYLGARTSSRGSGARGHCCRRRRRHGGDDARSAEGGPSATAEDPRPRCPGRAP